MLLNTKLYSVDTLHVEVPAEIDSRAFNEAVQDYSPAKEYNGVDEEDGGLLVSATDLKFNIAGYDNMPLVEFFDAVRLLLDDADEVYFYKAKVKTANAA